jgi:hypothetical protein
MVVLAAVAVSYARGTPVDDQERRTQVRERAAEV